MNQNPKLSIVIPTLNEADYIAGLLETLTQQTYSSYEIILADAGSTDTTVEIAKQFGVKVVQGGLPAVGRNAGASAATGDLILFLDADVMPPLNFIENIVSEFERKRLDVGTCLVQAISDRALDHALHNITNLYLISTQRFVPHAPGFVILIKRDLHNAIHGFDTTLALAEDQDYVYRAAQKGRFRVLRHVQLPVSVRRLEFEGIIPLVTKYLWVEAHIMTGQKVHSIPFQYQFGKHGQRELYTNLLQNTSQSIQSYVKERLPSNIFRDNIFISILPTKSEVEDEQESA